MNADERETVIRLSDADSLVDIWSAQRKIISALRRKAPTVTEVESRVIDGSECVRFTIPADRYNPASGVKRTVSPEERASRAEILARVRPS